MIARHVVRTEGGEEQVIELHEDLLDDKENPSLPAYLSDDNSPVKVCVFCLRTSPPAHLSDLS